MRDCSPPTPLRLGLIGLSLALSVLLPTATRWLVGPAQAAECSFRAGFLALHDLIPRTVGDCLEDEHYDAVSGDGLQRTTGGLLVWRKADNWTAFTDGATTWINGPLGLQSRPNGERLAWEAPVATPPPSRNPTPGPTPSGNPLVPLVVADAAGRAGVEPSAVQVLGVEPRQWPDASLGCPHPDRLYAQVITPGYLITVQAGAQRLEYHTDASRRFELCA